MEGSIGIKKQRKVEEMKGSVLEGLIWRREKEPEQHTDVMKESKKESVTSFDGKKTLMKRKRCTLCDGAFNVQFS